MEFFLDPKFRKEKEKRIKMMLPYQVNKKLLGSSDALLMHDMPIHRGYEITDDLVGSDNSVIYDQSENRLHSAKAILLKLLS
jgi:ornithine carbamoyltransferase